jgi:hypothetical protein
VTSPHAAGEVSAPNSIAHAHSLKSIPAAGRSRICGLSIGCREPSRNRSIGMVDTVSQSSRQHAHTAPSRSAVSAVTVTPAVVFG